MNISINISDSLMDQFLTQLNVENDAKLLNVNSDLGEIKLELFHFPNALEVYHFDFILKEILTLSSENPIGSDYLLLNINLSEQEVEKQVNGLDLSIQKFLPSGILFYPPNTQVFSTSPIETRFEILLIRFHKDLLDTYFGASSGFISEIRDTIIYEDLDFKSEDLLRKILTTTSKLESHAYLLHFLSLFFDKLKLRTSELRYENIHPSEIKQLFLATALLRNPLAESIPTIVDLAKIAGMSTTKFKRIFKQVFGKAPIQYHRKIRMEYAKDELQNKLKTSSEIAFELSYSDPSKFTRAFKNYFGYLPSSI